MTAASPQELVEHALRTSSSDQCVVIVHDSTSANLRWANNTLTTNGVMHDVSVTVIAFHGTGEGTAAGSVSASASSTEQVTRIVEQADAAAKASGPAEDANELVSGEAAADWYDPSGETSIEVYSDFAPALGEAFGRASADGRILYGFVDHDVTTTYLGTSTGLRVRHVQPTGHYGCTAKPTDLSTSAWVGGATRDFTDVDATAMDAELVRRLGWAERRVDLTDVPEAGHQQAALDAGEQVLRAAGGAVDLDDQVVDVRRDGLAGQLRGVAVLQQRRQRAVLDPVGPRERQAVVEDALDLVAGRAADEGRGLEPRVGRVGVDLKRLVGEPLADPRAAAALGEHRLTVVGLAGRRGPVGVDHQVRHRGGRQDRVVAAGLEVHAALGPAQPADQLGQGRRAGGAAAEPLLREADRPARHAVPRLSLIHI